MRLQLSHNSDHIIDLDRGVTDVIKLLSIFIIASHHFFQTALTRGDGGMFVALYCSQAGYLGVALFFFLSGYGLAKSNQRHKMTFREFVDKRFLKIVLPTILANLIWALFCFVAIDKMNIIGLSQKLDVADVSLGEAICSLMAFCSNTGAYFDGTLWFIKVLLLLYLAFFVSTCGNNSAKRLIVLAVLTVGVMFFVSTIMRTWMAISIPLFWIGVYVADCPAFYRNHLCALVFSFIVFCLVTVLLFYQPLIIHAAINYLVVLGMIVIAYYFKVKLIGVSAQLGVYSFDIYLTHNKARMLTFAIWDHPSYLVYLLIMVFFAVMFHLMRRVFLPNY